MDKIVDLALNNFPVTPNSLRHLPASNQPVDKIKIILSNLYHHYYLDSYGKAPPNPDPAQFEYLRFLSGTDDFRFLGNGLGASTAAKRHRSNELGQAFFRYFLHEYLGIIYFAHMQHVLDKVTHSAFDGLIIQRTQPGDAPDYLCAKSVNKVYIGEAKGRYSSVSFNNSEFRKWRQQFNRITVRDKRMSLLSLKGFIVATRFATENDSQRIKTKIHAEDPYTPGEININEVDSNLGLRILSLHYANIAEKLNQPLLASSLQNGFVLPDMIRLRVTVWELLMGPFKGTKFIGGYYSREEVQLLKAPDGISFMNQNILDLAAPTITFFGLEENIFRSVVKIARNGFYEVIPPPVFESPDFFYSAVSILKDGSIISPIDFLKFVDVIEV